MTPTTKLYSYDEAKAFLTSDERYAAFFALVEQSNTELAVQLVQLAQLHPHPAKNLLYATAFAIQRTKDLNRRADIHYEALQTACNALLAHDDTDQPDDDDGTRLESELVDAAIEFCKWSSVAGGAA